MPTRGRQKPGDGRFLPPGTRRHPPRSAKAEKVTRTGVIAAVGRGDGRRDLYRAATRSIGKERIRSTGPLASCRAIENCAAAASARSRRAAAARRRCGSASLLTRRQSAAHRVRAGRWHCRRRPRRPWSELRGQDVPGPPASTAAAAALFRPLSESCLRSHCKFASFGAPPVTRWTFPMASVRRTSEIAYGVLKKPWPPIIHRDFLS